MKSIKSILLILLPLTLGSIAGVAHADRNHGYVGHGPRVHLYVNPWPLAYPGIYAYGPRYYPYDYPYTRYQEVIVAPAEPTVYVEQSTARSIGPSYNSQPVQQSNDWYYCHKPDGYYPYVKNCPGGWQRVPAQPPVDAPAQPARQP